MTTIATVGKNKYRATFNRRSLLIDNDGKLTATDTATGEIIDGAELRSVRSLVEWHVKSRKDNNSLPTLFTARK